MALALQRPIPAELYIRISEALVVRGFGAPVHLFRFDHPTGKRLRQKKTARRGKLGLIAPKLF